MWAGLSPLVQVQCASESEPLNRIFSESAAKLLAAGIHAPAHQMFTLQARSARACVHAMLLYPHGSFRVLHNFSWLCVRCMDAVRLSHILEVVRCANWATGASCCQHAHVFGLLGADMHKYELHECFFDIFYGCMHKKYAHVHEHAMHEWVQTTASRRHPCLPFRYPFIT